MTEQLIVASMFGFNAASQCSVTESLWLDEIFSSGLHDQLCRSDGKGMSMGGTKSECDAVWALLLFNPVVSMFRRFKENDLVVSPCKWLNYWNLLRHAYLSVLLQLLGFTLDELKDSTAVHNLTSKYPSTWMSISATQISLSSLDIDSILLPLSSD